ncbi:MAG: shikimate dehydrogenase [Syntrophomonadaceae bacterium]|nr:shikimate dehydrogenase [Syntrophomonadaceae bacterium]
MIDAHTQVIGLIGNPLGHSLSPRMHNGTLSRMGINCVYLPFEVQPEELPEAVLGLRALNIRGVNVTIPYKQEVIPYLDELSPEAEACGAVNLIKNADKRLIGYNTDGPGFMASLAESEAGQIAKAVLIGAGGAAHSLAFQLIQAGIRDLQIFDLEIDRALELADFAGSLGRGRAEGHRMSEELFARQSRDADLIVNCTPVGMHPHTEDCPVSSLTQVKSGALIYDLIYNPLTTCFLSLAQACGLRTINGLDMLVHQGALTLEILLGIKPPIALMKEVVTNRAG